MPERNNCAILFPNFAKKQPKHPDYRGSATVAGVQYELSAWEKQGTRAKFLSLAFTPKQEAAPEPERQSGDEQPPAEEQPFIA
jgi:hypothetical protein